MRLVRALFPVPLILALAGGATVAPAAAAPAPAARPATTPKSALPFISDDYARALAEARARKIPLFIESWAPW
jgi:hypothetical protein